MLFVPVLKLMKSFFFGIATIQLSLTFVSYRTESKQSLLSVSIFIIVKFLQDNRKYRKRYFC